MNVFELPDDIATHKNQSSDEIIFHHYAASKSTFKQKSILKRNAFSLVISGTKSMLFAEKTIHIKESEIHLLSTGACLASMNFRKNKPFESFLIYFDNKVLLDFYAKYSKLIAKAQSKPSRYQSYLEFEKDEFIKQFIQSVLLTVQQNQLPSNAMKRLKLEELFLYLLENHPDKFLSFKASQMTTNLEFRIRKVVEANSENNLTIEELAFLCSVSISTFKRYFNKIYGCSPKKWTNEQRMKLACKMLAEEKPGEIWHKLGFETHTGFTKFFKKHHGVTPKDFVNTLNL